MSKLPVISGKETVKALSKIGFYIHHQKGSHIVMKKDESPDIRVVVPNHKELKKGMLGIIEFEKSTEHRSQPSETIAKN